MVLQWPGPTAEPAAGDILAPARISVRNAVRDREAARRTEVLQRASNMGRVPGSIPPNKTQASSMKSRLEESRPCALSLTMKQCPQPNACRRRLALNWVAERPFPLPIHNTFGSGRSDIHRTARRGRVRFRNLIVLVCLAVAGAVVLTGCTSPSVRQQRLVSKPNMLFSDSAVFAYSSRLLPQLEPGSAMSGGAQNAGCTSCR